MKKIISLLLVLVFAFSLVACNNLSTDYLNETVELDIEMLKNNWDNGEITFSDGTVATIPCVRSEMLSTIPLVVYNGNDYVYETILPGESTERFLVDKDTKIGVTFSYLDNLDVAYFNSLVTAVTIEDIKEGNRWIKIGGALTTGVCRADLEKALGVPEGANSGDDTYTYISECDNRTLTVKDQFGVKPDVTYECEKIILTVTFNEKDIVSKIYYAAETKVKE